MKPERIEADFWAELAQIQAESIGWIPLGEGVYLHVADEKATEIEVVGLARADMQSSNVVWVV
ncbi:MAG: hypothetical protein EBT07_12865 [Actinobacteria bacterium]|nr:hypothetical protein [Actinomycetota bacterium]